MPLGTAFVQGMVAGFLSELALACTGKGHCQCNPQVLQEAEFTEQIGTALPLKFIINPHSSIAFK